MRQNHTQLALTGPGAGAQKYDLLTALGAFALSADRSTQRRVLRLITLITARYNWRLGEMTIGRREIAHLWCVDERTVKREIGALRSMGILTVKRPGARGRVTAYGLDLQAILSASEPAWDRVGPDFAARMRGHVPTPAETVVPFPGRPPTQGDGPEGQGAYEQSSDRSDWGRTRLLLKTGDPARFAAWYAPLQREGRHGDRLILRAPSAFHADYVTTHMIGDLIRAAATAAPGILEVEIIC
ncbi:MAG: hypothetical protein AAGJ28_00575 [Pseudomonadota bacterium]